MSKKLKRRKGQIYTLWTQELDPATKLEALSIRGKGEFKMFTFITTNNDNDLFFNANSINMIFGWQIRSK